MSASAAAPASDPPVGRGLVAVPCLGAGTLAGAAVAARSEKLTKEADTLAEYQKLMKKHDLALSQLNKSFDQVQSSLEHVAAVKPSKELLNQ